MQQYQFEKIYSLMEKEFGKIRTGQEEDYNMLFFPMESNLLKIHRKYPASNSRRLREAIALVLFDIKSRYTGEEFRLDNFRDENNARLEQALLMAFDPFTNDEIRPVVTEKLQIDLEDRAAVRDYYTEPVVCILRIKDSVDAWEKRMGPNGYFEMLEGMIGIHISGDGMSFSVLERV